MPEDPNIHKKLRAKEKARIAKLCKHEQKWKDAGLYGIKGVFWDNVKQFNVDKSKFPAKKGAKTYRKMRAKHEQPMKIGYAGHKGHL